MKKPLRDDMSIYTPKLINIVLPKLSHDTILAELKSREPALFKFVGKLAEKIVSETFNEGDSAIEIASKIMISFQSAKEDFNSIVSDSLYSTLGACRRNS